VHEGPDITARKQSAGASQWADTQRGTNLGAAFFDWSVAVRIAVLLTSIVGAVGAAVGFGGNLTKSGVQRQK
jgi:hypothetical protein